MYLKGTLIQIYMKNSLYVWVHIKQYPQIFGILHPKNSQIIYS